MDKLTHLMIDDLRWPRDIFWIDGFDFLKDSWRVVRNYDQFVEAILEKDWELIALDHDLCPLSTCECIRVSGTGEKFDYSKIKQKTGKDCALFLKEFCKKNGKEIPPYIVHSLNAQGRENIINILGKERLVATHSLELVFDKADEILDRRKNNFQK